MISRKTLAQQNCANIQSYYKRITESDLLEALTMIKNLSKPQMIDLDSYLYQNSLRSELRVLTQKLLK
jgi:hypothetical protein